SYAPGFGVTTTQRISEIDALVNGSTARKYLLSYGSGDNGYRSLLTSVQQQGYDDNNNLTTLPATTFTYSTTSLQFYSSSGALPVNGPSYVIADTNGNGINDVNWFYKNNVSGLLGSNINVDNVNVITNVVPPEYWSDTNTPPQPQERGIRYIDVNGDGKADVVR